MTAEKLTPLTPTLVKPTSLGFLPESVAEEMKQCALAAGESMANKLFGSKSEAATQKKHWEECAKGYTRKAEGLLSEKTCTNIQHMLWFQASHAANYKNGFDNKEDIKKYVKYFDTMRGSCEVTRILAANIYEMGRNMGWYCANNLYGCKNDAAVDKVNYEEAYRVMYDEVELKRVEFLTDKAKVKTNETKMLSEQILNNNTDKKKNMSFECEASEGTTTSLSLTVGFKYSTNDKVEIGFEGIGEAGLGASFEFPNSMTFKEAMSKSKTRKYTFPLVVPPHTSYKARGLVNKGKMEVPYQLVFSFWAVERTFSGIWTGVAVSKATCTYEVCT